jgi:hypothetical protein
MCSNALTGLNSGFLAVVATLKLQFARSIALGNAIAGVVNRPVQKHITPLIESILPHEFKKWASFILEYGIRTSGLYNQSFVFLYDMLTAL